jgi:hypothetical protein
MNIFFVLQSGKYIIILIDSNNFSLIMVLIKKNIISSETQNKGDHICSKIVSHKKMGFS